MRRVRGVPDFAVEVLSPATAERDHLDKKVADEGAGVRGAGAMRIDRSIKLNAIKWTCAIQIDQVAQSDAHLAQSDASLTFIHGLEVLIFGDPCAEPAAVGSWHANCYRVLQRASRPASRSSRSRTE